MIMLAGVRGHEVRREMRATRKTLIGKKGNRSGPAMYIVSALLEGTKCFMRARSVLCSTDR